MEGLSEKGQDTRKMCLLESTEEEEAVIQGSKTSLLGRGMKVHFNKSY